MIIADTGFWIALANRRDRYHQNAVASLKKLAEPLIVTWPIMTETCHLLLSRLGIEAQRRFLKSFEQHAFRLFQLEERHVTRLNELFEKYADLPMDLADASLVILAEEQGIGRILSTDQRDFNTYRWKKHHPFENLLAEPVD